MVTFNDINRTSVLIPIVAFQLNNNQDCPYGWEIHIALQNGVSITLNYSNKSTTHSSNYYKDCETLLNL